MHRKLIRILETGRRALLNSELRLRFCLCFRCVSYLSRLFVESDVRPLMIGLLRRVTEFDDTSIG